MRRALVLARARGVRAGFVVRGAPQVRQRRVVVLLVRGHGQRVQRLLLREDLLLELELRLLPLALGLLLRLEAELLRPELLRPLDAVPRLLLELLLREDDDPDLEEEEELRDAMACSFGRMVEKPSLVIASALRSI